MLRSVHASSSNNQLSFNLHDLATDGHTVAVGRELDNAIRLDSTAVPYLLSRHHATLVLQPDGSMLLTDLDSTNGTFVSRSGSGKSAQAKLHSAAEVLHRPTFEGDGA